MALPLLQSQEASAAAEYLLPDAWEPEEPALDRVSSSMWHQYLAV